MTTIKCPICKDRLSATNTDELNANLREHLADVHNMRDLTRGSGEGMYRRTYVTGTERPMERREERRYDVARGYPYDEIRPDIGFTRPESRTEREVETWSSRDPERFRAENYIPREEVRQWRYPVTGEYGERGPYYEREGRGREERYERREVRGREYEGATIVNCPLCGATVRGRDEDDLSDELRYHMKETHDIRPKMTARF